MSTPPPRHSPPPSSQAPKPKGILKNPLDRRPSSQTQVPQVQGASATSSDAASPGTGTGTGTGTGAAAGQPLSINTQMQGQGGQVNGGLHWDEQNIALHDIEKESTQRMKIDEPKTPFVRGSGGDDEGFEAFNLDSTSPSSSGGNFTEASSSNSAAQLAANTNANAALGGRRPSGSQAGAAIGLDSADLIGSTSAAASSNANTMSVPTDRASLRSQSRSPSFSLPSSGTSSRRASSRSIAAGGGDDSRSGVRRENAMDVDGAGEEAVGADDEDEDEDEETRAQREAFAKKRNAHYGNEAEALKIAQALAAKDDEEEDDDDDAGGVPNGGPNGA